MTEKQWQLYDPQGRPLDGSGASKQVVYSNGLLHGAAHVWIWRKTDKAIEVLLQKRAADKNTWPNLYDISAAGHIDVGEESVIAAVRETKEEIGLEIAQTELQLFNIHKAYLVTPGGAIENEFQWLYLLELTTSQDFTLQRSEVASLIWKPLDTLETDTKESSTSYVPHGNIYYQTVIAAIQLASS